jgi:hypothetical protein
VLIRHEKPLGNVRQECLLMFSQSFRKHRTAALSINANDDLFHQKKKTPSSGHEHRCANKAASSNACGGRKQIWNNRKTPGKHAHTLQAVRRLRGASMASNSAQQMIRCLSPSVARLLSAIIRFHSTALHRHRTLLAKLINHAHQASLSRDKNSN